MVEDGGQSYSLHTLSGVMCLPDGSVYGVPHIGPCLSWGRWSDLRLLGEFLRSERPGGKPFDGAEKGLYAVRHEVWNRRIMMNRLNAVGVLEEVEEVVLDGPVWDLRHPSHRRWLELADRAGASWETATLLALDLAPLGSVCYSGFVSFHTGRLHLRSADALSYCFRRDDGAVFVVSPVRYSVCPDRGVVGLDSVGAVFLDGCFVRAPHRYFNSLQAGTVDWNEVLYSGLLSDPRSVMLDASCSVSDRTELCIEVDTSSLYATVRYGEVYIPSRVEIDRFLAKQLRMSESDVPAPPAQDKVLRSCLVSWSGRGGRQVSLWDIVR